MPDELKADHYGVLGVAPDASTDEIRRAYRRLARRHHPDHNPHAGGPERFVALARAYEILNDPAQRAHYDEILRRATPPARRPLTPRPRASRATRHGILELSPREARHLARHPLNLTDAHGRTVLVPAGAGRGDTIALLYDDTRVILTIELQRNT